MEIIGYPLESIYLYGFIISGALTLLYVLLSDILEGVFEAISEGPLNPTLILAFLAFLNCTAYILERFTNIHSLIGFLASAFTAFILVVLINIFILVPLSQAEATMAFTDEDLKGRTGTVLTSIPDEGFGEVMIQGKSGTIARSAVSFEDNPIAEGEQVLIIDVENGVLHVTIHEKLD